MSDSMRDNPRNEGHGHVFPRPDGIKARCGGPALCQRCAHDLVRKNDGALEPADEFIPKRVDVYLHSSKEDMYNKGQKLGLTEKALEMFMYACYEVKITLDVNNDGKVKIVAVDDRKVM